MPSIHALNARFFFPLSFFLSTFRTPPGSRLLLFSCLPWLAVACFDIFTMRPLPQWPLPVPGSQTIPDDRLCGLAWHPLRVAQPCRHDTPRDLSRDIWSFKKFLSLFLFFLVLSNWAIFCFFFFFYLFPLFFFFFFEGARLNEK